jgi:hypothetical protein
MKKVLAYNVRKVTTPKRFVPYIFQRNWHVLRVYLTARCRSQCLVAAARRCHTQPPVNDIHINFPCSRIVLLLLCESRFKIWSRTVQDIIG